VLLGIAVRQHGIAIQGGDHPLRAFLVAQHLPPWMLGLLLSGFIAAVLSTADELLNCCSFSLIYDVFQFRPKVHEDGEVAAGKERRILATGRFYVGLFGLVGAGLAILGLQWGDRLSDLALAVFSVQVAFAIPIGFAMFGRNRAPRLELAGIVGTWAAFCSAILLVLMGWLGGDRKLSDGAPVGGFLFGILVFLVVAFFSRRRERA
jgi:Na+/proline symporter